MLLYAKILLILNRDLGLEVRKDIKKQVTEVEEEVINKILQKVEDKAADTPENLVSFRKLPGGTLISINVSGKKAQTFIHGSQGSEEDINYMFKTNALCEDDERIEQLVEAYWKDHSGSSYTRELILKEAAYITGFFDGKDICGLGQNGLKSI